MQKKLGEILLRLGYINETDIDKALEIQLASKDKKRLGEILSGFILNEEQLLHALAIQQGGYKIDASLAIVSRILSQGLQQADIERILKNISADSQEDFIKKIADLLGKIASFIDISHRLSDTLSLDSLLQYMMLMTSEALNADRSTLFLNDRETGELFSRIARGGLTREIRVPNHIGVVGAVFTGGQPVIIHDVYADPRFNKEIDKETGYRTKNLLCAPIRARNNETIGAIQLLNKKEGDFNSDDLTLLEAITSQASSALQNARLFEEILKVREEETLLLNVTTAMSSELKLWPLLLKIMETMTDILNAERSTLFLYDEKTDELWSLIAQGADNAQLRFPSRQGIAGSVFTTGETVNIPDAYADTRFNPEIDRKMGYRTNSILCMPVINKAGKTIGVTQALNKKGGPFTGIDENRLKAFSS